MTVAVNNLLILMRVKVWKKEIICFMKKIYCYSFKKKTKTLPLTLPQRQYIQLIALNSILIEEARAIFFSQVHIKENKSN